MTSVEVLRTADDRFEGLQGWPFEPRYRVVTSDDGTELRMAFVDEGPVTASPVLLLHGNPSWSYLHRRMIEGLAALGHRVVALDLVGLGRSDKPSDPNYYTLARHVDWVGQWLVAEDLADITLYCQDWGGTIGLNVVRLHPDRFARIIVSNTGLPVGDGVNAFMKAWLDHSQSVPSLDVGALVAGGTTRTLSVDERRAYDAPFPDASYQAGIKQFPLLIALQPDNPGVPLNRETWSFLATWTKPLLTVFGSEDAVAFKPGAHRRFQSGVPGAAGMPHRVVGGANHFIQEDASDELVRIIDAFIAGFTDKDRVIALLREEWRVLNDLLGRLSPEEWVAPALPSWSVHDVVAHIVGMERTLRGDAGPDMPVDLDKRGHVLNEQGRLNEAWIEHYRRRTHDQLHGDFLTVTTERLEAIEAMSVEQFEAPAQTPIGDGTYARFMQVRVFDCWMHEQDIRAAIDRPGHERGLVAEEALAEVATALGYIVGKRAGAPDGSSVTIRLSGHIGRTFHVKVDGKARQVARLDSPATATISMAGPLFMRLAGGRIEAAEVLDQIELGGDVELAGRVASNLAYTI